MTNDVESLIKDNYKYETHLNQSRIISCKFYKELWKYILVNKKNNFNNIYVKFKIIHILNDNYISENNGIEYLVEGNNFSYKNKTYYDNCDIYGINDCLNEKIDVDLLCKLISDDNFEYKIEDKISYMFIEINFDKENINKIINDVLNKNKLIEKNYVR